MLDREIDQAFNMVRTHAIFCTSFLPVRQISNKNEEWVKHNGAGAKLMIQPTKDIDGHYHGVPFGSYGRLVLIWLQTEAVRTHTPRIHLGSSMHEWLGRMNIRQSGRSYQLVRNQAKRIERSVISVTQSYGGSIQRSWQDFIVRGSFTVGSQQHHDQEDFFEEYVELSETFFDQLIKHPARLWEPAIRALAQRPLGLDLYTWLAYRLHVLKNATPVGWQTLHAMFGTGTAQLKHFKPDFLLNLEHVLTVYRQARVEINAAGIIMHPSAPPVIKEQRLNPVAAISAANRQHH